MIKSILKSIVLVFGLSLVSSCVFTQWMWETKMTGGHIDKMFLDNNNKRVVLVGVKNPKTGLGMNYSITNKNSPIFKIVQIGLKSKDGVLFSLRESVALVGSSRMSGKGAWITFNLDGDISLEDKKFLEQFENEVPYVLKGKSFGIHTNVNNHGKLVRYPSSKEKFTNICSDKNQNKDCSPIIKLHHPWKGPIRKLESPPVFFGKIILTPATMVADILYFPIYFIALIGSGIGGR